MPLRMTKFPPVAAGDVNFPVAVEIEKRNVAQSAAIEDSFGVECAVAIVEQNQKSSSAVDQEIGITVIIEIGAFDRYRRRWDKVFSTRKFGRAGMNTRMPKTAAK